MKSSKKTLTLKKETVIQMSPFSLMKKNGGLIKFDPYGGKSDFITNCGCPKSYPQNCCDNV